LQKIASALARTEQYAQEEQIHAAKVSNQLQQLEDQKGRIAQEEEHDLSTPIHHEICFPNWPQRLDPFSLNSTAAYSEVLNFLLSDQSSSDNNSGLLQWIHGLSCNADSDQAYILFQLAYRHFNEEVASNAYIAYASYLVGKKVF
jgi:hypothetical protein